MKKNTKETLQDVAITAGGAAGLRFAERAVYNHRMKQYDFKNFDEVLNYYKDVKQGDSIFYKDTFTRGKSHPVVVTGTKNYAWPSGDQWEKGVREKPVGKNPKPDPKRPWTGWGRVTEVGPDGKNPIQNKSLWGMLYDASHRREVRIDPKTGHENVKMVFDPKKARELGGIYRAPDLDPKKFNENLNTLRHNERKGVKNTYSFPGSFSEWKIKKNCGSSGTCVTFAQGLIDQSKKKPTGKVTITPGQFARTLEKVKGAKVPDLGKSNYGSTVLGVDAVRRLAKGYKNNDSKEMATAVGEGVLAGTLNTNRKLNEVMNNVGGFAAQSVGGMTVEQPAKLLDKVIKNKKYFERSRAFLGRNPGAAKGIGTVLITPALAYGAYKAGNKITEKQKTK